MQIIFITPLKRQTFLYESSILKGSASDYERNYHRRMYAFAAANQGRLANFEREMEIAHHVCPDV